MRARSIMYAITSNLNNEIHIDNLLLLFLVGCHSLGNSTWNSCIGSLIAYAR